MSFLISCPSSEMNAKMKIFFILTSLSVSVLAAKMPSRFKRCNYKDKACFIDAAQDALGKLPKGLPEFKIDSIDPLTLPELVIPAGNGIINFEQNYKNLSLNGVCYHKVKSLDFDLEQGKLVMEADFDEVSLMGNYNFDGKILLLPVRGNGPFQIKAVKGTTTLTYSFDVVTVKNQRYIKGKKCTLILKPNHVSLQFDNLFDGNKLLGDNINQVLNDNWKEVIGELGPAYFGAFAKILENKLKAFFDAVPVSEIFLDQN